MAFGKRGDHREWEAWATQSLIWHTCCSWPREQASWLPWVSRRVRPNSAFSTFVVNFLLGCLFSCLWSSLPGSPTFEKEIAQNTSPFLSWCPYLVLSHCVFALVHSATLPGHGLPTLPLCSYSFSVSSCPVLLYRIKACIPIWSLNINLNLGLT